MFPDTNCNFLYTLSHITPGISLFQNFVLSNSSLKTEQCRGPVFLSKTAIISTFRQCTEKASGDIEVSLSCHPPGTNTGGTARKMGFPWCGYNDQFLGWPNDVYW